MTLDELAYQIEGELDLRFRPGNSCELVLLDNVGEPAKILPFSAIKSRDEIPAMATGKTPEEAKVNLVNLLRGKILQYEMLVWYATRDLILRIPETLETS